MSTYAEYQRALRSGEETTASQRSAALRYQRKWRKENGAEYLAENQVQTKAKAAALRRLGRRYPGLLERYFVEELEKARQ